MISQGSQGVGRLAQLSFTCLTIHRNNLPPSSVQRVSSLLITHCGITPRNHNVYISPTCWRTYTDNPVSRPKAHTGRTSGKPKKPAKPPSTKEPKKTGASQAKRRPKSESRTKSSSKTKTTRRAKAKAKPKRKSKPRSRTKKVLTDDQKARLARRIEIQKHKTEVQKRKELKTTMLKPPKPLPASAWTVFVIEYFEKAAGTKVELGAMMRNAGSEFRQLTPERLEV